MKLNPNQMGWARKAGWFALGATAGSAVALLYAPQSGRATRKQIALKFRSLERSAARGLNRTRKSLLRKVGNIREAAEEKWGQLRERAFMNGKHPARERRLAHHA